MLYSMAFALLLIVGIWSLAYLALSRTLRAQDEGVLQDRLHTIQFLLNDPSLLRRRVEREWYGRGFERIYVRVTDAKGQVVAETPSLANKQNEILELLENRRLNKAPTTEWQRIESRSGGVYLLNASWIHAAIDDTGRSDAFLAEIALDRTVEQNLLASLWKLFLIAAVIAVGASLWMGRSLARMALQPIENFAAAASRVDSERLHERLVPSVLPIEFRAMAETWNGMLDRLQASFDRLSQFSADMAHELRTPLNNLMGSMTVALSKARTPEMYSSVLGSCIEECERLKRIIESLLFIARAADPSAAVQKLNLDLESELLDIVSFYEASAEEAGIRLRLEIPVSGSLRADRTLFQRCIGNLISNSIRHSTRESEIILKALVQSEDGKVRIEVIDQGCGIPAEALAQIGERFFRVDASRSKSYGGTGLGLSIVSSILHLHGGALHVKSQVGAGTTMAVEFPG